MKLSWSDTAVANTDAIYDYIAANSPMYARIVIQRIRDRMCAVLDNPYSGEVVPEYAIPQIRQVISGTYRIIYRVTADEIEVLGVLHGALRSPL